MMTKRQRIFYLIGVFAVGLVIASLFVGSAYGVAAYLANKNTEEQVQTIVRYLNRAANQN